MALISALYNYWMVIVLMMIGLYIILTQRNLVKKIIGLNIFQTAIYFFFVSVGKIAGGSPPILSESPPPYSNPLPHVLILTAIIVGVATMALALGLVVRINEAYGCIDEHELAGRDGDE